MAQLRNDQFVSEPIRPVAGSFDPERMSFGEPALPGKFRWRRAEVTVAEVLERWKEHGDCSHGSGERYLRKHVFRIRATDGRVMRLYFQRSPGRGKTTRARWWIYSVETAGDDPSTEAPCASNSAQAATTSAD